jgi:hypothetical protein
MTGMSLFVRPSGAYVIFDTASYSADGVLMGISLKVMAYERLGLLVGTAGRSTEDFEEIIGDWLVGQPDQATAILGIDMLLRELHAQCHHEAGCDCEPCLMDEGVRLAVAGWSAERNTAFAFIIESVDNMSGAGRRAYTPTKVVTMFSPPMHPDPWPGHSFDPEQDALDLALAQRQARFDGFGHPYRVGGSMEMIRIDADGARWRNVCMWCDTQGEKIDPAAPLYEIGTASWA